MKERWVVRVSKEYDSPYKNALRNELKMHSIGLGLK
jgi:hypothetical protein